MKRLLFFAVLLSLFFACGGITEEVETYIDEENGYSISFPKGWDIEEQGEDEEYLVVIAHSPSTGILDDFTENINVGLEDPRGFDLESYMDASLENMETLEDFELIETGQWEQLIYPNRFFIYEHSYDGVRIKALSSVVMDDNAVFLVTCTATQESYIDYESLFIRVCESFEIL